MQADNPYANQNQYTGEVGNNTFGGGAADSQLSAPVLALLLIAVIVILVSRRKSIIAPVMLGLFLLPMGQSLVMGGAHLYVARILVVTALARLYLSRKSHAPLFGGGFNTFDKLFIAWGVARSIAFLIRFPESAALVNQAGVLWDVLGGYFLMRALIHDQDDCLRWVKGLSAVAAILAIAMLYEHLRGVNLFGVLTGSPIPVEFRKGSYRAKGPFHHAILAGTFAATLVPLFFWLWKSKKARLLGLMGVVSSGVISLCAASSTPMSSLLCGIMAIFLWPLRANMRMIRWGIVLGIIMLNFAMHAPVWWAIEHVDLAGGSAGEHRAELVDNFIRHFGDWWAVGTSDNAKWGFEMWDLSDQYVAEGEQGGLATFVLFVTMLVLAYKRVGASRKESQGNQQNEWYFWLLGATLFAHTIAFFGISYFDQTKFAWYGLLAVICATTAPNRKSRHSVNNGQFVGEMSPVAG